MERWEALLSEAQSAHIPGTDHNVFIWTNNNSNQIANLCPSSDSLGFVGKLKIQSGAATAQEIGSPTMTVIRRAAKKTIKKQSMKAGKVDTADGEPTMR